MRMRVVWSRSSPGSACSRPSTTCARRMPASRSMAAGVAPPPRCAASPQQQPAHEAVVPRMADRDETGHVLPEDLVEHERLAEDRPALLPKVDRVDGLDEDRQGIRRVRLRRPGGVEVPVIARQPRGTPRLVDQDGDGGIVGQERLEARPERAGPRGGRQSLRGQLVDRRRVMIEHDEPMLPLRAVPRVHGREILDEGHGHRFESEIGHEQHLWGRGPRQAVQLGRHDGTHVGIARHVHDPGDVGMSGGHGRRAIAVEIMVGELRDLHEVGDFHLRHGPRADPFDRRFKPVVPRPQSGGTPAVEHARSWLEALARTRHGRTSASAARCIGKEGER